VLDEAESLAEGFHGYKREVIRHLLLDPYLPDELLPSGLARPIDFRERYTDFNANYSERSPKNTAAE